MTTEYIDIQTIGDRQPTEVELHQGVVLRVDHDISTDIMERTRKAFSIPAKLLTEKVVCLSCGGHFHRSPDGSIPCGH